MSTLRELASESIGRITRRGLEPQIAQIEAALLPDEQPEAIAPGKNGVAGVVVVLTTGRVLVSVGAPFAQPTLDVVARADVSAAAATAEDTAWTLSIDHPRGPTRVMAMYDRDAQRLAALLRVPDPN